MNKKLWIASLALLAILTLSVADTAEACTQPPIEPPIVHIIFHEICCDWNNPNNCYIRAWIIVRNYTVFGGGPGQFCACAFNKTQSIVSVDGFKITESGTTTPAEGFCFHDNDEVAVAAGDLSEGDFSGFQAAISSQLRSGATVDLHFDVTLAEGTTPDQLAAELESQGVVVTGESDGNGNFVAGHTAVTTGFVVDDQTNNCSTAIRNGDAIGQPVNLIPDELSSATTTTTTKEACPIVLDSEPTASP